MSRSDGTHCKEYFTDRMRDGIMKNHIGIICLLLIMAISAICLPGCKIYVHAARISQIAAESMVQAGKDTKIYLIGTAEGSAENGTQTGENTTEKSPETGKAGLKKLKKKIEKDLKGKTGQWSVYVKNLDTNEYMLINNKKLPSASLIKLFVMMTAYEETENGSVIKEDSSFNGHMKSMITVSDNESANMLTRGLTKKGTFKAGIKVINKYCKTNGYTKTRFLVEMGKSSPKNVTSAKDCGWALERMYRGTAVRSKSSKKMIRLLKKQTRIGKIPAGIPKGVTVANKTGETDFAENDAAIVYSDGADYVIVVMSKNGKDAVKEIRKISEIVYGYFN